MLPAISISVKKRFPESQGTENKNTYCHTKGVRKMFKDFKTTPWQSLPTCLKLTLNLEKSDKSNFTCLIYPHTQPSAPEHTGALLCQLCPWSWANTASCILSMDNNLQHFLKWPGFQMIKHQLPQLRSPCLRLKTFGIDSLPRAALYTAKYIRARKRNPLLPLKKKTNQPNKSTLRLQSLDICKKMEGGSLLQGICLSTAVCFTMMTL